MAKMSGTDTGGTPATIEITAEMKEIIDIAADKRHSENGYVMATLRKLIGVIERDYFVQRKCGNELAPGIVCSRVLGETEVRHGGEHRGFAPSGASISWSDIP